MTNTIAANCRLTASHVGCTPSQVDIHVGTCSPAIGWTLIQPTACIACTVPPTIDASTTAMRTPVTISMRR